MRSTKMPSVCRLSCPPGRWRYFFAITFLFAPLGRAASIFDDDYSPPKRIEPSSRPSAPEPSAAKPAEVAGVPSGVSHVSPAEVKPASGIKGNVHRAVPSREARAKCRKLFEEVYATQLKDRSPVARRKLAKALLAEAEKADEGSPDRFVLLNGAMQAAEEGQNLRICFDSVTKLASGYDVDELDAKTEAATKTFASPPTPAFGSLENTDALDEISDQVLDEDAYDLARKVEAALQRASAGASDANSKSELKNEARRVSGFLEARQKLIPALEKLKTSPDDPAANLAVGSFNCFQLGRWGQGLPHLAKSNDARFKEVATAELAAPPGIDARLQLADMWLIAASKLSQADRLQATRHAEDLFRGAENGTTALQKLAIEKRLAQIHSASQSRHINLLALLDPTAGVVKGTWRMQGALLMTDPIEGGRIDFAYRPPPEYDFHISFTMTHAEGCICQVCYRDGHQFGYQVGGWYNKVAAFEMVNGIAGADNKTAQKKDHWLADGQHHSMLVKVRRSGAEAFLDGQLITSLRTDYSDLSLSSYWTLSRADVVGLGAHMNGVRFDTVEIIEVNGKGRTLSR